MNSALSTTKSNLDGVTIRPLREEELPVADRIMRLAFGTFLGLPDPLRFMGDAVHVRTRWLADPSSVFAAELNGELVGTNFATRWGSVGFFGPLTIRPDLWDRGIAKLLLAATMELFDRWEIRHAGLFTFAASAKHVALYQQFGFWPRFLTALMELPVSAKPNSVKRARYGDLSADEKKSCLMACSELTSSIYEGLDLEREIRAVDELHLGDTLLTWQHGELAGIAVCHVGPGSEAGSGKCYVKFGAVRCGPNAPEQFQRLLEACQGFASQRGAAKLEAGVNLARLDAYRAMLQAGFRTATQGVAMQRDAEPGYNRPDVFLIDDWR
jgi:GNAT superfamily N-acetyltransferase